MNATNPIKVEYPTDYDPDIALAFFKLFGTPESAKVGKLIFAQGQKANRFLLQHDNMYLLVKGDISIQIASETIARVKVGEIFGELTPLILSKRSASAIAEVPCRLISLSEKQLLAGLKQQPEFALMLMCLFVKYLRQAVTGRKAFSVADNVGKNSKKNRVFDTKMLQELVQKVGEDSVIMLPEQRIVFQEGGIGLLMYIILEGSVVASIGHKVVERSGIGSVIGEIALIDQKQRVAKVVTETRCLLLALNRQMFLELIRTEPQFSIPLLRILASRLYLCRKGYSCMPSLPLFDGF